MRTLVLAFVALGVLAAGPALAKQARCFSSDDGYYDCDFQATGGDGSFEISAPGYPTFALVMDGPGEAFGFGTHEPGGRAVALPGRFVRAADDRACWDNAETGTRLCAW